MWTKTGEDVTAKLGQPHPSNSHLLKDLCNMKEICHRKMQPTVLRVFL